MKTQTIEKIATNVGGLAIILFPVSILYTVWGEPRLGLKIMFTLARIITICVFFYKGALK